MEQKAENRKIEGIVQTKAENGGLKIAGLWYNPDLTMIPTMGGIDKESIRGKKVTLVMNEKNKFVEMTIVEIEAAKKTEPTEPEKKEKSLSEYYSDKEKKIARESCIKSASEIVAAIIEARNVQVENIQEVIKMVLEIAEEYERWITR